ncbi:hypothetical protein B296_00056312 [Ensete ventricosum]|uniref:Uncharacterized protein n=1 Tax=Ensete ventricosum TaxID=4639 RepID=A0A426X5V7_ENSVE|nr:hypothetical protein B296_00056312 [Ensete ventricosum]
MRVSGRSLSYDEGLTKQRPIFPRTKEGAFRKIPIKPTPNRSTKALPSRRRSVAFLAPGDVARSSSST